MKSLALSVFLFAPAAFAATPDTLVDKVYRETIAIASIRQDWEKTIVFQANGRFTTLVDALGSPLNLSAPNKMFLQPTRDGTYVYQRISDTSAHADLTYDDGTTASVTIPDTPIQWSANGVIQISAVTTDAPTMNLSLRGRVEPGRPLIAGFVVGGSGSDNYQFILPQTGVVRREFLIRVVGPGLAQFGVTSTESDPAFQIFQGGKTVNVWENIYGDWSASGGNSLEAAFRKVFQAVGAFPLESGSKDAAAVVRLGPGAYTIVCNAPEGDTGGEVLIEVYLLP